MGPQSRHILVDFTASMHHGHKYSHGNDEKARVTSK